MTTLVLTPPFNHRFDCPGPDVYTRYGRVERVMTCRGCGRTQPLTVPESERSDWEDSPIDPAPRGRFLLICCRCNADIWLHRPTPRVPLCDRCKRASPTGAQT